MLMPYRDSQTLKCIVTNNCLSIMDCKMPAIFPSPVAVPEPHRVLRNISTVGVSATHTGANTAPNCTLDRHSEQSVGLEVFVYSFNPPIICIPPSLYLQMAHNNTCSVPLQGTSHLHNSASTPIRHQLQFMYLRSASNGSYP